MRPHRFGLPVLYAAVLLFAGWLSHFAMLSNDVFPLRWQANHLSLHHPETFYNGFFPIGYPLLLRFATLTGNSVLAIIIFQIALAAIYARLAWGLLQATLRDETAILALPFVLFMPQIAGNVLSVTPDFLAAMSAIAAFCLLAPDDRSSEKNIRFNIFFAGVCLGAGYLFRIHIIVLVLSLTLALLIFEHERRFRAVLWLVAGAMPFVIAQGILQAWTGHGFFENAQAFNMWRMIHGMDWNNPPALGSMTAFAVMRSNSQIFFTAYRNALLQESGYILPTVAALFFLFRRERSTSHRTLSIFTFTALIYLVITAIGGSPRNVAPVIPIIVADVFFVIGLAFTGIGPMRTRTFARGFAAFLWSAAIVGVLVASNHSARRVEEYTEVERILNVHSKMDALKIYTDDFDFYFPDLRYRTPRVSGGWQEVGLPDYLQEFPHVRDSSALALHDDLVRNGVRWAMFRTPPYDVRGDRSVRSDTTLFHIEYQTPMHNIYRVE